MPTRDRQAEQVQPVVWLTMAGGSGLPQVAQKFDHTTTP